MTAVGMIISRRKACTGAPTRRTMAQAHKIKLRRATEHRTNASRSHELRLAQLRT
jgi:hypothetical protein